MNGIHDMGGWHGYGEVVREQDEPFFHYKWEAQTLGLARAVMAGFHFNLDEFRHVQERMEPSEYLSYSYYQRWLEGTITLLQEKGVISEDELQARVQQIKSEEN